MLKSEFQLISGVEIWGAEIIYFEIWGGHAPPPPPGPPGSSAICCYQLKCVASTPGSNNTFHHYENSSCLPHNVMVTNDATGYLWC